MRGKNCTNDKCINLDHYLLTVRDKALLIKKIEYALLYSDSVVVRIKKRKGDGLEGGATGGI